VIAKTPCAIPRDWAKVRLKFLLDRIEQGWSPQSDNVPAEGDEWGVLKAGCVNGAHFNPLENKRLPTTESPLPELEIRPGDVLMSRANTTELLGSAAFVHETRPRLLLCDKLYRLRVKQPVLFPEFLVWFLASAAARSQLEPEATGASNSMQNIGQDSVGNLCVALPPPHQQRVIADYLGREARRLDALVAEKERLVALLAEKRRALITRAVTRGLDPAVPLRDSGHAWIGHVPEHWRTERMKFHLNRIEQGWSPQCDSFPADDDEWAVLKVGAVNEWQFDASENKRLPPGIEPLLEYQIRPGDVLMSRANTRELLGSAVLVHEVSRRLLLCDKLYRLVLGGGKLVADFLVCFLRSAPGRYEFERDATGASNSMQNIGQDSVRNAWVPVPPLDEQHAIVAWIERETGKLDALRAAAERTTGLLRERRAALIAAAVTGQLAVGS